MKIWKDVAGYEGLYKVSSSGEIYSVLSQKVLKPIKSSTGYYHVSLYSNKKQKSFNVHTIVASAFLPEKEGCIEINHIDGDKSNNSVDNLERVSKSENMHHAIKMKLRKASPMQGRTGESNPMSKEILQYSLEGVFIQSWKGIAEVARILGCSASSISNCLIGKHKSACGFIWRYKESDNISIKIDIPKRVCTNNKKTWEQKNRRQMREIKQLTKDGKLVKIWKNYIELSESTGFDNGNIYNCINGKLKSAYGYIWRYVE